MTTNMSSTSGGSISSMRLYGSAIGVISGIYSIYLATTGMNLTAGAWFMLALGAIVIVHGLILLTPLAARLGAASGPLMIVYSLLMLLNQGRMVLMPSGGMSSGMDGGMNSGMGGGGMTAGAMSWDAGMVAIAALMLASGIIMTVRSDMMKSTTDQSTTDDAMG